MNLSAASPLASARRLTTPLLLIHGAEDRNTPPDHTRAIAAADPKAAVWLVEGAGHTGASASQPLEFRARVLRHFHTWGGNNPD